MIVIPNENTRQARGLCLEVHDLLAAKAIVGHSNALKHSGTKEVHVSMDMADAGFSLVVEDTGCGFEANGAARQRPEFPRTGAGNDAVIYMGRRL